MTPQCPHCKCDQDSCTCTNVDELNKLLAAIAREVRYPEEWDTVKCPTLPDAIAGIVGYLELEMMNYWAVNWIPLTSIEHVVYAKYQGWQIQTNDAEQKWEDWSGTAWRENYEYRGRPKPSRPSVKEQLLIEELMRHSAWYKWLAEGDRGEQIRDWILFQCPNRTQVETLGEAIEIAQSYSKTDAQPDGPVDPDNESDGDKHTNIVWHSCSTAPRQEGVYMVRIWEENLYPQRHTEIKRIFNGRKWMDLNGHVLTTSSIPGWHEKDEWGYVPYDPTQEVT